VLFGSLPVSEKSEDIDDATKLGAALPEADAVR
jgi:hypothetical protein